MIHNNNYSCKCQNLGNEKCQKIGRKMSEHFHDTDVRKSVVEFAQVKKYQKFFDDILFSQTF